MSSNSETPAADEMHEWQPSITVDEFLGMLRRRKWLLAGCIAIALASGVAYFLNAERTYEVKARLLVRHEMLPLEDRQGPARYNEEFLATQAQIIVSPAVVGPVVESLAWGRDDPTITDPAKAMLAALTVQPVSKTDIIDIAFRSPRTSEAVNAVEAIITSYKQYLGSLKQDTYGETLRLLTRTEKDVRTDLEKLEKEYRRLREEGAIVGQGTEAISIYKDRLANLDRQLNLAKSRRVELEGRLQTFKKTCKTQLADLDPVRFIAMNVAETAAPGADAVSDAVSLPTAEAAADAFRGREVGDDLAILLPLMGQLGDVANVSADLEEMTLKWFQAVDKEKEAALRFGDKHHLLQATRDEVKAWEKRIRQQIESIPSILERELEAAQVYEDRLAMLYHEELEASIRLDSRLLKERQALAAVERVQAIHDSIQSQLRQLQLEGEAAASGHTGVKVTVLAEPKHPSSPVWPSLPIVLAVCGLIGLVVGGGVACLVDRTSSKMRSLNQVEETVSVPALV